MAVLGEQERIEWSSKQWDLALRTKNPVEVYEEYIKRTEDTTPPINIDELPNKDWLRA